MTQPPSSSFTSVSAGGLLAVLKNRCAISQAFDPATGGVHPPVIEFDAIWDTGATNSVITQDVIDACGLAPIGVVQTHGVHGAQLADVFLVNIYLPNHVAFGAIRVTKGLLPDAQILIGMDLISHGDFAVTNFQGITKFSFRFPSMRHIDFVQEHNDREMRKHMHGGRNKFRPKKHKTFGINKHKKKK